MEEKSVELVTNPQKIVLLDKGDTKERLEKLEKALKVFYFQRGKLYNNYV